MTLPSRVWLESTRKGFMRSRGGKLAISTSLKILRRKRFLQVYQKLDTLKDPSQFPGWLYVITNRQCLAWLRKKRVQTHRLEEMNIEKSEKTSYSSHIAAEQAESAAEAKRELVKNLLVKLKESDRTAIRLYYLSEMTYAEIGELLGVSAEAIRIRIRRARERLKKHKPMIQEALDITIGQADHFHKYLHGGFRVKLTFERDDLLSSLQVLGSIVSNRNAVSAPPNVLIQAEGSTIECMATDAEMGIRMKVDGTVKEAGSILVLC